MAVTSTETVRDLVTDALLDIEAGTLGQPPSAEEMAHGVRHLGRMLKAWQGKYMQFLNTGGSLTMTTAASYTLSPVRPLKILSARLKVNGIETPMIEMSRNEYDELPDKTSTGRPTQFYYDRQKEAALFYVWPVLSTAAGETVEYTYAREFEDISGASDIIDIPAEWYDAVVKNLAVRLSHTYGSAERRQMIRIEAKDALDEALAGDLDGSAFFIGADYA